MSEFSASVGNARATSVRLVTPWRGAWYAEVDLDPDSSPVTAADVPSGRVTIAIQPPGGKPITLVGTVDPQEQGRFVSTVRVHVNAGGGGWSHPVPAQHFANAGGLSSLTVESATAGLVGETVNDPSPVSLGTDWARESGPASTVFADRQWYVDAAGVTQVAQWPASAPDASAELLSWDPLHQRGELAADALVLPGTVLTDPRFDGPITVRDVDQTFSASGIRATVWCSPVAVTRLISVLTNMVRQLGALSPMRMHRYRIVQQNGATLDLQPVAGDGPELRGIHVWPGMAGLSAQHRLSAHCAVMFLNGDRSLPVVVGFDGAPLPHEATLDAAEKVHIGPSATVDLAGGTQPIARQGDTVTVLWPAALPVAGTLSGAPFTGVITVTSPAIGQIQVGNPRARA